MFLHCGGGGDTSEATCQPASRLRGTLAAGNTLSHHCAETQLTTLGECEYVLTIFFSEGCKIFSRFCCWLCEAWRVLASLPTPGSKTPSKSGLHRPHRPGPQSSLPIGCRAHVTSSWPLIGQRGAAAGGRAGRGGPGGLQCAGSE